MNTFSPFALASVPFAALAFVAGSTGLSAALFTVAVFAIALTDYTRVPAGPVRARTADRNESRPLAA